MFLVSFKDRRKIKHNPLKRITRDLMNVQGANPSVVKGR